MSRNKLHRISAITATLAALGLALALTMFAGAPASIATVEQPGVHEAGTAHELMPKRIEAVVEIDMNEFSFSTPGSEPGSPIRIPAGQTVGLHLHNEGVILHELVIGRKPVQLVERTVGDQMVAVPDGYAEALFQDLESDVFFYYGSAKAEVGGAKFEELELDGGLRDAWIRLTIPPELAGEWEIGCFVPGHYEAGMRADLIVE